MPKHARLSASESHRWIACPGSVRMNANKPNRRSEAASLGTAAHALGEQIMLGTIGPYSQKGGEIRPGTEFKYTDDNVIETCVADQEMIDNVMIRVDNIRAHLAEDSKATYYGEQRVSLEHIRAGMFGTLDDAVYKPRTRTLVVSDYKNGVVPVHLTYADGHVNSQLLFYAAGMLKILTDLKKQVATVVLQIVQPRCMEVETVQSATLTASEVTDWAENTLWEAAGATEMANAPLCAGEHCRWCPSLAECPAMLEMAQGEAMVDFAELPDASEVKPKELPALVAQHLAVPGTPRDLAKVLRVAPLIDAWLRACEAQALDNLSTGVKVPGFKLVRKRANRAWPTDDVDELYQLIKRQKVKGKMSDFMAEPKFLSPAQLEKLIGEEVVNAVAVKPDGGLTVATERDKREEVNPFADFEELL